MRRQSVLAVGAIIAMVLASAAQAEEFHARLGRVPVDSRTQSTIAGLGRVTAELDGSRFTIEGDFAGLLGPATEANLHMGSAVGVRGPVIQSLSISTQSEGEVTGSMQLAPDEVVALRAGRLYIQIHSEIAPEGNLWGWLLVE